MGNREARDYRDRVHLFLALRRKKENGGDGLRCIREIIRDEAIDLERLKVRLRAKPGVWRIHRTVNARSVERAAKALQHRLIDNPDDARDLESVWRTCLLQPESRAERKIMLDVDAPLSACGAMAHLERTGITPLDSALTPSGGCHIVCNKFDTRLLAGIEGLTIQRDGYIYIETLEVSDG